MVRTYEQRTPPSWKRHNLRQSANFKAKLTLCETEGRIRSSNSAHNNAIKSAGSRSTPTITGIQILSTSVVVKTDPGLLNSASRDKSIFSRDLLTCYIQIRHHERF